MDPATVVIGFTGAVASAAAFLLTSRDAARVGVSRPLLWACATSGTLAFGVVLFLFTSAPMPGVLMTANTGSVLYGFERELTRRDDEPAEPGQLPFEPVGRDGPARTADGETPDRSPRSTESGPDGRTDSER